MALFISCHFLIWNSIVVLEFTYWSFVIWREWVEPWTLVNGVPSGENGTFLTYSSLVRAQPLLSFPYVSIKTPFINTDTNGRCCSRAKRCLTSRDAHMASRRFFLFWLRACRTHTSDFFNLSHSMQMTHDGVMATVHLIASSREHWLGSFWINICKRSSSNLEGPLERGVSKLSFFKRENHFLAVLSPMVLSPCRAQRFLAASAAFTPPF